ncbi:peptidylprolyl isomerase [Jatrophihabitans sp.]|uniref:peptidylprolyl isomerase n=1 Tax=Jatrophihabitans sp. TaxID=1932789 RepID=UPI0030C6CFA2|nr:peptidylprolyl isomerase [Jatrophihabitans sp.]
MPTDKQRREASRRELQQKLQQRQASEAQRRRTTLISSIVATVVIIAGVIVLIAVNSGGSKKAPSAAPATTAPATTAPATTGPATTAAAAYPCTWTAGGTAARKVSVPATTTPPKTGATTVAVQTTQGAMTFTLNRAAAPCTVASFVSLVQQKFYDKTPCHRLTTAGIYVLQCGDPTGTGTGGPGYTIPDEYKSTDRFTTGVLAMANTGQAHSGGSQFFIVYKDSSLPPQYTIFGTVRSGLSVVEKVAAKGSNNANGQGDGKPNLPITISSMTVK